MPLFSQYSAQRANTRPSRCMLKRLLRWNGTYLNVTILCMISLTGTQVYRCHTQSHSYSYMHTYEHKHTYTNVTYICSHTHTHAHTDVYIRHVYAHMHACTHSTHAQYDFLATLQSTHLSYLNECHYQCIIEM